MMTPMPPSSLPPRPPALASSPPLVLLTDMSAAWTGELLGRVAPFWSRTADKDGGGFFCCVDEDGSVYDDANKPAALQAAATSGFARLFLTFGPSSGDVDYETAAPWLSLAEHGAKHLLLILSGTSAGGEDVDARPPVSAAVATALLDHAAALEAAVASGLPLRFSPTRSPSQLRAVAVKLWRTATTGVDGEASDTCGLAEVVTVGRLTVRLARDSATAVEGRAAGDSGSGSMGTLGQSIAAGEELMPSLGELRAAEARVLARVRRHLDTSSGVFLAAAGALGTDKSTPFGRRFVARDSLRAVALLLDAGGLVTSSGAPSGRGKVSSDTQRAAVNAARATLTHGWDIDCGGGLLHCTDIAGKEVHDPLLDGEAKTWDAHAEALAVCARCYEIERSAEWLEWLARLHTFVSTRFTDRRQGGGCWYGWLRRDCSIKHRFKGAPSKGFCVIPDALIRARASARRTIAALENEEEQTANTQADICTDTSVDLLERDEESLADDVGGMGTNGGAASGHGAAAAIGGRSRVTAGGSGGAAAAGVAAACGMGDIRDQGRREELPEPTGIGELGRSMGLLFRRAAREARVLAGEMRETSAFVAKDISEAAEESGFTSGVREIRTTLRTRADESGVSAHLRAADAAINRAARKAAVSLDRTFGTTPLYTIDAPVPPGLTAGERLIVAAPSVTGRAGGGGGWEGGGGRELSFAVPRSMGARGGIARVTYRDDPDGKAVVLSVEQVE